MPRRIHKPERENKHPRDKLKARRSKRIDEYMRRERHNEDPFTDQNGKESPHLRKG